MKLRSGAFRLLFKKFKRTLRDAYEQMNEGEMRLVAASLAFSTLFSLVPFLAVTLATFKVLGGLDVIYPRVEAFLLSNLAAGAGKEAIGVIRHSIGRIHAGVLGTGGALFLIAISMRLLHDMEWGIHRVWNIPNRRPLIQRIFTYWFLILLCPMFLAVYVGFLSLKKISGIDAWMPTPMLNAVVMVGVLYAVYKLVPNVKVKKAPALFAAIMASLVLSGVQGTFTWIAKFFFNYGKIYGSVAALPIFLLWLLTIWYVILGGVVISASAQKRELLTQQNL